MRHRRISHGGIVILLLGSCLFGGELIELIQRAVSKLLKSDH
jgi:hypothetical protein